jgi:hypothetical protein
MLKEKNCVSVTSISKIIRNQKHLAERSLDGVMVFSQFYFFKYKFYLPGNLSTSTTMPRTAST